MTPGQVGFKRLNYLDASGVRFPALLVSAATTPTGVGAGENDCTQVLADQNSPLISLVYVTQAGVVTTVNNVPHISKAANPLVSCWSHDS